MNESTGSTFGMNLLREHPALVVSGVYVLASTIGMFFSWEFLLRFGINVFNFAQLGDFMIASLREPMTWALVALAVSLVILDNTMSRRWQRKERSFWTRWYGSPRYRVINYLVAILMVSIFIDAYANHRAKQTFAGDGQVVSVQLADSSARRSAILLYTTGQFVFLFDATTQRVTIYPVESVQSISFLAPKK